MIEVFVGVGSNSDPHRHVSQALAELEAWFGDLRVSNGYHCPPVGFEGADFINLVVGFETALSAHAVRDVLREIEASCGRDRDSKQASQPMDLDLLLYGDAVVEDSRLVLPRPDILKHAFVLKPLAELVPDSRHPVEGVTYAQLWAGFDASRQPLMPISLATTPSTPALDR